MKLKSLYTKLLLSFLGVLFITMMMILALFIATAGRNFKDQVSRQSAAKLIILKDRIQAEINKRPFTELEKNKELNELLKTLSNIFDLKIWVTDSENITVLKTFLTPVNIKAEEIKDYDILEQGIKFHHLSHRHIRYYAQIPVIAESREHILHVYFENERERQHETVFLLGLLCIGGVIALLLIPLTGIITRRIKLLKKSALELADGNLSSRADIKGYDEIAELGDSFNFMADKLEKMIQGSKELTANISHELRSPLTRITVAKELLEDKLDKGADKDMRRYLENIALEIESLDMMIDKILKLSKMDYMEPSLSRKEIDLDELLTALAEKSQSSLQKKKIALNMDIEPGLKLNTDRDIIFSVFSNLFDNAVKYTDEEGEINIAAFKKENGKCHFNISNTFRILEQEELENIFQPFYRVKGNKKSGSGFGLTIVKKQLEQINGSILARNSKKGLLFEVEC